jgi:uncharacterized membrane protein YjjP (DUF1212 family)
LQGVPGVADAASDGLAGSASQVGLVAGVVRLLLSNGQTTERTVRAAERIGGHFGMGVAVFPGWGETGLRITTPQGTRDELVAATPAGVDMLKVTATLSLVDEVCEGRRQTDAAIAELDAVARLPPVSIVRFVSMAAAGAAALGVVFGATRIPELLLIAVAAGFGALLRRGLAKISHNLFVQPLAAALLAGVIGAVALRQTFSPMSSLVAVCPCMVLVPGPHLLNGGLDLVRGRIPLGMARIGYASVIIVMVCTGLLVGLALGGASLPIDEPSAATPLVFDALAAGIAVLAYGTFFNMTWTMLPIPVVIGMSAHALRWALIGLAHASLPLGAFVACLLVGLLMTPIADRLHLPFAGCAFASVVSLIPGVFLFRMAGTLVDIVAEGGAAPPSLVSTAVSDGTTALTILVAMAAGLILPKMLIEGRSERG